MQPVPLAPRRSAVPRVVGVLAFICAVIGLGMSFIWWFGPLDDVKRWDDRGELGGVVTWLHVWMAISGVLFLVHLIGGIVAVQYKRSGLKLLTIYSIAAIALAILDVVLCIALVPKRFDSYEYGDLWFSVVTMHIAFSVMALPWPITTLALVNGARAKEACGQSTQKAADVF
jgi:hypothetical protein